VRAAIIGYGLAGRWFHAPLITACPGLEVGVVVTGDAARAAQARADHPEVEVVARADQIGDVDFVVVATPNAVHAGLAQAAIARGLPVVVDKPLAVSATEAERLVTDARAAGVALTVFHNRRWDSDQVTLRRLIADGALGTVRRYESRFERWRPEADPGAWRQAQGADTGGGVLLDLGAHLVDQALALFGPVTHVYAELAALRGTAGDDDAFLALRHAGGVISHLRASAVTAAPGPRLRVLGSEAAYVVSAVDSQEDALRAGRLPGLDWGSEPWQRGRLVSGEASVPIGEPGDWPQFYALWERTLSTGDPPPVDPADAVAGLRVLEASRESARTCAVVGLAP
jgi:scyllo-inositol 2-dehydrogenase (NADP+)